MAETQAVLETPKHKLQQQPQEQSLNLDVYWTRFKQALVHIKGFDYKKFFQDILTFLSIIIAYFTVSLSYQFPQALRKLLKVDLKSQDTLFKLIFAFSVYFIFWKIVGNYLKARAMRPPPKKEQFEQMPTEQPEDLPIVLQPLPNGQQYAHDIIYQSLNVATYFFLLTVAICAYAYLNQPIIKKVPQLVTIQHLNYVGIWFLLANLFNLSGGLIAKITKMGEFRVLGVAMAVVIGVLILGVGQKLNTFIFI